MGEILHKQFIANIAATVLLFNFGYGSLAAVTTTATNTATNKIKNAAAPNVAMGKTPEVAKSNKNLGEQSQKPAIDLSEFGHLDPKRLIPDSAIIRAVTYLKKNIDQFANRTYMAIVDYTKPSSTPRLFIVNLKTGDVEAHLTTHGKGSDPRNTGLAQRFSNAENSDESSLGFYHTAEVYEGKHGTSLRLDGLSATNSNARARGIVIHAAWYVKEDQDHAGHSEGCIAVDEKERDAVIDKLKDGALIYGWRGQG